MKLQGLGKDGLKRKAAAVATVAAAQGGMVGITAAAEAWSWSGGWMVLGFAALFVSGLVALDLGFG